MRKTKMEQINSTTKTPIPSTQKAIIAGLWYFTQYASYMFDDDAIIAMKEGLSGITATGDLLRLLNVAPDVSDKYNEILFGLMIRGVLNDDNIAATADAWEELKADDLRGAFDALNAWRKLDDILEDTFIDYIAGDVYELEEMADEDLKANGIKASALHWYQDLPSEGYAVIDCMDRVYSYRNEEEALLDYVDESRLEEALEEAIKEAGE